MLNKKIQEATRGEDAKDLTPEERRAKAAEVREKLQQAALEVLTPQQQKKFDKMKGAKVDFDFSKLWPPGAGMGLPAMGGKGK